MIIVVIIMKNVFDSEITYKLYRTVGEILHPAISKKNLSDYRIIIDDKKYPMRVFFPKKVSEIHKVILYVHGNAEVTECEGKYSSICRLINTKTDRLLIAIEYEEEKNHYEEMVQKVYETIKHIYQELLENGIREEDICFMGDSTGCHIMTGIHYYNHGEIPIKKEVLFYPTLSLEYFGKTSYESITKQENFNPGLLGRLEDYFSRMIPKNDMDKECFHPIKRKDESIPNTLIIVGNVDIIKDEAKEYYENLPKGNHKYVEIAFSSHGFFQDLDKEIEKEVFDALNKFLEEKS